MTRTPLPTRSHPRPDHHRGADSWTSLDGPWELSLRGTGPWQPVQVPAPWESALSGVGAHWVDRASYRRRVSLPVVAEDETLVLHFQAVHHRAEVRVDGRHLTTHVGGQLPFEVDLTAAAGHHVELQVDVEAPLDKASIPHGKQRSIPVDPYDGCAFTPCSGIWQSVWLERRPRTHLVAARFVTGPGLDRFVIEVDVVGDCDTVSVTVPGTGDRVRFAPGERAELVLSAPRPWSPQDPHLYELQVALTREGRLLDQVSCTTGLRTVEVHDGRVHLNGAPLHLRGVLDQGYWPTSGWTAPDDAALEADLLAARAAGFTMVRKHLKLEDPRWLHAADRLGVLVWAEPPCVSRYSEPAIAAFEAQLGPMVERDRNHPSIIIWGVYNEEWGLDWDVDADPAKAAALARGYERVTTLDPTRPVVDNSGWSHVRTDLLDWHVYSPDQEAWRASLADLADGFDVALGVEGGLQHKNLHADKTRTDRRMTLNSEYGTGHTGVDRAWTARWQTQELRRDDRSAGYVYCELYDVEHESAGVLTFDRRPKDDLALPAHEVHADTVIVTDLLPHAVGADLLSSDGEVAFTVRVSCHREQPGELSLHTGWGPVLGTDPGAPAGEGGRVGAVRVEPFVLSGPLLVSATVPAELAVARAARLHLWLRTGTGTTVAHSSIDVRLG